MNHNPDTPEPETNAESLYQEGLNEYNNKRYASAVELFREAAENGYAKAQVMLGVCCRYGLGIQQDYTEAARWFHHAAEQGNADGQYLYGALFLKDRSFEGPESDYKNAVKWFQKAAEQGHPKAQYALGMCYYEGHGVPQDPEKAARWLQKAAEQYHAEAQYRLGVCYLKGIGVTRNLEKAIHLLTNAVDRGAEEAQNELRNALVEWFKTPHDHEPGAFEKNNLGKLDCDRNDETGGKTGDDGGKGDKKQSE